jgi:nucleoside-diphosphate-sugar epimerase
MNKILAEDIRLLAGQYGGVSELRGKTVMITGATGLIGSCLVRFLLLLNSEYDAGIRVIAVVRNEAKAISMFGPSDNTLRYYVHDFMDVSCFQPNVSADYIVHLAAPTASRFFADHPAATMLTVVGGTRAMLDYARRCRAKAVVFASSLEVYGTVVDDSCPLTESMLGYVDTANPRSSYPVAKRAAEALCHAYAHEYGVPVRIARLAQTFGAGIADDDNRVFAQFARAVVTGSDITLHTNGTLRRCYCYTTDAVDAILCLLIKGSDGEVYNVANENTYTSIMEMAQMLCDSFMPGKHPVVVLRQDMGYSPATKLRLNAAKLRSLGWKPRYDLPEMFARLIASMRVNLTYGEP